MELETKENKNKKILTVILIALLVILLVGISFAFFTYTKYGSSNVIQTGGISLMLDEDDAGLNLTNKFPQTDEKGKNNDVYSFQVVGRLTSSEISINYEIYALAGEELVGKVRLADSEVNIYVQPDAISGDITAQGTIVNNYDRTNVLDNNKIKYGNIAGNTTGINSFKIAEGTISASGNEEKHGYTLTMWVNDSVTISDTDVTATYRATDYVSAAEALLDETLEATPEDEMNGVLNGVQTKTTFKNTYYSLKLKLIAENS